MDKTILKGTWGQYIDTDKLVDDIRACLRKYGHPNTEHGVCTMLETFFTNKKPLIDMFVKSEHYTNDLRIVLTKEFQRECNSYNIATFCSTFSDKIQAKTILLSRKDANGKTAQDYMKLGIKSINAEDLLNEDFVSELPQINLSVKQFNYQGYTKESIKQHEQFYHTIREFKSIDTPTLSHNDANRLNDQCPKLKAVEGQKTSRAFNRVCALFGIDKAKNYNKLFAEYADMVSGLKRQLDYVISLNPYDYLTMSFGNSWASCHTIDKNNTRGMPNAYSGQYCGGTLSYMLDSTSIIVYVVDKQSDPQTTPKIYRNMFHFGNNILIQGRIYPQGNDGVTDLYKTFRKYMQDELSTLIGLKDNMWTKSGQSVSNFVSQSYGVHYQDYIHYGSCNVSYPSERKSDIDSIVIGHDGICPNCGEISHRSAYLTCGEC